MAELQRYASLHGYDDMGSDPDGDWVRCADVEPFLQKARERDAMLRRMEWTVTDNAKQRMMVDDLQARLRALEGALEFAIKKEQEATAWLKGRGIEPGTKQLELVSVLQKALRPAPPVIPAEGFAPTRPPLPAPGLGTTDSVPAEGYPSKSVERRIRSQRGLPPAEGPECSYLPDEHGVLTCTVCGSTPEITCKCDDNPTPAAECEPPAEDPRLPPLFDPEVKQVFDDCGLPADGGSDG